LFLFCSLVSQPFFAFFLSSFAGSGLWWQSLFGRHSPKTKRRRSCVGFSRRPRLSPPLIFLPVYIVPFITHFQCLVHWCHIPSLSCFVTCSSSPSSRLFQLDKLVLYSQIPKTKPEIKETGNHVGFSEDRMIIDSWIIYFS
jgi:hypothetical protein